jgi:hypothetical protein
MLGRRCGTPSGHVPGGSTASANLSELVSKGLMVRAIVVAAKLKIADLIAEGARSADELAHATGVHAPSLYRLLRALRGLDLLVEDDAGRFSLGPLGDALRTGRASLREHAAIFGDMSLWDAWGRLEHSVRTGEPAFRHAHGVSRIDHLHPRAQADRGTSKLPAMTNRRRETAGRPCNRCRECPAGGTERGSAGHRQDHFVPSSFALNPAGGTDKRGARSPSGDLRSGTNVTLMVNSRFVG